MFEKKELENWLFNVSRYVSKPVTIYLIGGCAMSFKGYKAATKDIDIVMLSKADFDVINSAIMEAGYKLETDLEDEFYLTALAVYLKGDSRIDLFLKKVGKMLAFTPKMAERATIDNKIGLLTVALVSNEDIFLKLVLGIIWKRNLKFLGCSIFLSLLDLISLELPSSNRIRKD